MGSPAATRTPQRRAPASRKPTPRREMAHRGRLALLIVGALVLFLFFVAVLERVLYAGDVMPGVQVVGVDVAGASEGDAYADLAALAATLELAPIEATIDDETVSAEP